MGKRLPKGPLEGELQRLCNHNAGVYAAPTLRLPKLRALLESDGRWDPTCSLTEPLVLRLRGAIGSLSLGDELKRALGIDLALEFPPDGVPAAKRRAQMAAAAANCSLESYRHNRGDRSGRRKVGLQALERMLDPGGQLGAAQARRRREAPASPAAASWRSKARYHPLEKEDLESGLWWRDSTREYIEQLAGQSALTIFAGTDGPADVGPPLHGDVMVAMLRDCLNDHPILAHLEASDRDVAADELVSAVRSPGATGARPGYIGSIVRGLWSEREGWDRDSIELRLHNVVQNTTHQRVDEGFVATAITRLAFALRSQGKPVKVVSAHFDNDLVHSSEIIRSQEGGLRRIVYDQSSDPGVNDVDGLVPLVMLHGAQSGAHPGTLMVGEADLVGTDVDPTFANGASRLQVLEEMFSEASVVLVGTSLTDPGLLTAIARTRSGEHPRFALLPSPISDDMPPAAAIVDRRRGELLAVLASRYLYLDVVPIVVDFRCQVPQLLIEVARRVVEGENYRDYAARVWSWWERWEEAFGYGPEGDLADAREQTQRRWHECLRSLRDELQSTGVPRGRHFEDLMIEVWLRDPRPTSRNLFRWANSEGIWERSKTAPVAPLREVGDITQKTFREGRTIWQEITPGYSGRWRYCVAMNLVLTAEPWANVPVGVVKVFSTAVKGRIQQIENSEMGPTFEALILDKLRELFDDAAARRAVEVGLGG